MSGHFGFCYHDGSLRLPEGSSRSSHFNPQYRGGYFRDDAKKRHVTVLAGRPAPRNAWEPQARCPAQPDVSLEAIEPEAAVPTTIPTHVLRHDTANLADPPPLPYCSRHGLSTTPCLPRHYTSTNAFRTCSRPSSPGLVSHHRIVKVACSCSRSR